MLRSLALAGLAVLITTCGGGATPAPTATATASSTPTTPAATSTATGTAGARWTVTDASKATVSVREQLAGFSLPSDAVLTAKGAKGTFALNDDGSFSSDSKITIDLGTISSDEGLRDSTVKDRVLQTRQFPTATFVPTKLAGVSLPLADGAFSGTLSGTMTIRGITKDVTFAVKGTRTGKQLSVTATADPVLTFGQFGMEAPTIPGRVLSIVDAIHLTVDIVATS